jgi:FkbM family methyltransferase
MSFAKILKVAWRARSAGFAADYAAAERGEGRGIGSYVWRGGDGRELRFRRGTSDVGLIYDILLKPGRKSEYWLPERLQPACVLDIGGNIGVASRYLAHRFPAARIHAFEPVPENVELLRGNSACEARISVHPYALGREDGEIALGNPDPSGRNRGGYSAVAEGERGLKARVRAVGAALADAGVSRADVIKVDTEGAEFSILSAFPEDVLGQASWIYGELHSESIARPEDFRTLDLLSRWFDIEVYKPLRKRNYFFDACRRDLSAAFRDFRRGG